jgi:two-component system, cell cycle sensor histidine kinase and response regulator CckA
MIEHSVALDADRLRIVLVEGDANEARRIAYLFGRRPHPRVAIELAYSLADGTRAILGSDPDLVLLDLDLPDGRGLDVLHQVRHAHAHVPIVVLAACDTQGTAMAAVNHGAQDYLVKTAMNEDVLARTVETVISHERLLRQQRQDALRATRDERAETVGRMTMGLVHDFKNLLMVIQCNASLLRQSQEEAGKRHSDERIDAINVAAQRGNTLCRQILAFCKGDQPPAVTLDLRGVVASMLPLLERIVQPPTAVVQVPSAEPVYVYAKRSELEHVIINLVLNAEDSLDSSGHIAIETHNILDTRAGAEPDVCLPQRAFGALFVTDDGCGMDAATQSHIFDDFFSTKLHGTGLGLSMVVGAVQRAGGAIAVDSELGRGSRFRIYIPATPGPEPADDARTH